MKRIDRASMSARVRTVSDGQVYSRVLARIREDSRVLRLVSPFRSGGCKSNRGKSERSLLPFLSSSLAAKNVLGSSV